MAASRNWLRCDAGRFFTNPLHRMGRYARRIWTAFSAHQCSLMACACAYCALLSLVPLLVVGISILGFIVGGSDRALTDVIASIHAYVPINPGFLRETLYRVLQDRRIIGAFGFVGLIYGAHYTFLSLEPAMNMVWVVPETRHWTRQRLIAVAASLLTLTLLGLDLASSAAVAIAFTKSRTWLSGALSQLIFKVGLAAIPVLVTCILFASLYRMLPARRVPWKASLVGALVAALLWQATKLLFGLFVVHVHSYDRLYGSLSSLVVLVVWAYYTMTILLLGAEIAADYEFVSRDPAAAEDRSRSGADLAAASHEQRQPDMGSG